MADIPLPPMPEKNIFDMLFDYCKTNKSLLAKRHDKRNFLIFLDGRILLSSPPIKIKGESLSDRPPGAGIALKSFISIIFLRNKTLRINMVFNKGIKNQ
jgi:hypothetical protein